MNTENIKRVIEKTADGSHTLFLPDMDEHYHSVNGAIQESRHVFIDAGLHAVKKRDVKILEIGFGTGLNALLTWKEAESSGLYEHVEYYTIERYPVTPELVSVLNYEDMVWPEGAGSFNQLHDAEWGLPVSLSPSFTLHKMQGDAIRLELPDNVDLVYFDAFAPEKQPEMWELPLFEKIYRAMSPGGIFVTYCAKGEVRRNLQSVGFSMQRLPGPPGKRHMLFGLK